MPVLTATFGAATSTINPPQSPPYLPDTYTYTDSNGNPQTVTVNYSQFTIQTAFGCSVPADYNGPNPWPLVTSIAYPDGGKYSFTYEPTPSTTHAPVNQEQRNSIATVTVLWHVHPSGHTATHSWAQPPSAQDRSVVVPGPINIVVGAGNHTVYFYDSGNMNLHMSLRQFMGTQ